MERFIDLHLHSKHSDGALTPKELLFLAHKKNLSCVSITDHDTFDAYWNAPPIAQELGIELICGIEISGAYKNKDVHILGYFCDPLNKEFVNVLEYQKECRQSRVKEILEKLSKLGIFIKYENVEKFSFGTNLGRPHIAKAMLEIGVISHFQEAFEKYLGENGVAHIPIKGICPEKAVETIINSGGLAVFAHPEFTDADELIPVLVECGMVGIEVYNFKTPKSVKKYKKIAQKLNLVLTGGSDFHAEATASSFGEQKLPYSIVEELRNKL